MTAEADSDAKLLKTAKDGEANCLSAEEGGTDHIVSDDVREDRLAYLADMIRELQVMAHQSELETLSGILGLAHIEARQKLQKKTA